LWASPDDANNPWFSWAYVRHNIDSLTAFAARWTTYHAPPSPGWLAKLPIVGAGAAEAWDRAAEGGLSALVQDIAVYLGSDESSFTTGTVNVIDGGWSV
jgi:hypothetical protein